MQLDAECVTGSNERYKVCGERGMINEENELNGQCDGDVSLERKDG